MGNRLYYGFPQMPDLGDDALNKKLGEWAKQLQHHMTRNSFQTESLPRIVRTSASSGTTLGASAYQSYISAQVRFGGGEVIAHGGLLADPSLSGVKIKLLITYSDGTTLSLGETRAGTRS